MKSSIADSQNGRRSSRRLLIAAPVLVLLGIGLAGFWVKSGGRLPGFLRPGPEGGALSGEVRNLLSHLDAPVDLRFYAVLPPDSAPESLQDFSRRVDRLLTELQNVNGGQIHVIRHLSPSDADADAAGADGLRPFNLEKGGACFLGFVVVSGHRKELLDSLKPEWEPALPFDLARAILRVTARPAVATARTNAVDMSAVTAEIKRLVPDLAETSLDDGASLLRAAAMEELTRAGAEMEKKLEVAQRQLETARRGGSEAEQETALKLVQQIQLEQGRKYKEIAARLQLQITAFEQLKAASPAK